jgi:heme oxygenase
MSSDADAPVLTEPLSVRLRAATRQLHADVEQRPFVQDLLRGRIDRAGYTLLLRNLCALYEALERGLEAATLAPWNDPWARSLRRTPALHADLSQWHGPGWHDGVVLLPAAQDYAAHLDRLARQAPVLLSAHAYVRYLGDLSGGQALARVVTRHLRPPGGPGGGVAFYDFGDRSRGALLARQFRDAIDRLGGEVQAARAIVAEACAAFVRHRRLFDELDAAMRPA